MPLILVRIGPAPFSPVSAYHPRLHRLAVVTTCVALLLPITAGALVTTLKAGMAFPDWPTSDGQSMFSYPWLQSAGDKFAEHGHRLAGIVIGLLSVVLAVSVWKHEQRFWVRVVGMSVQLVVILQGLLGGLRVLANEDSLALIHGLFAALTFALMASVALVTSRSWIEMPAGSSSENLRRLKPLAIITTLIVCTQFVLGAFLRHLGMVLYEHLGSAFLVVAFTVATVQSARATRSAWLQRPAQWLLTLLVLQVALGSAAWIMTLGFPWTGYVAVQHSVLQILVRTGHAIVGLLLLMTTVNLVLRVFRLQYLESAGKTIQTGATTE